MYLFIYLLIYVFFYFFIYLLIYSYHYSFTHLLILFFFLYTYLFQLESMRFKFPESPEQELRAMSYVNTLREMNPAAHEFNHLIKLFAGVNDDSCLYILTHYCRYMTLYLLVQCQLYSATPTALSDCLGYN
jgi:hypothetical protein